MFAGEEDAAQASGKAAQRLWLALVVLLLAYRLAYHVTYVAQSPFALATFSDGSLYEQSARDLAAHPPWGTRPFYLQGLYAYQIALGLALSPDILAALLVQLGLAALGLFACAKALLRAFPDWRGRLSFLVICAYFPLAFYENKYLSAAQGVLANVLVWLAFTKQAGPARAALLGVTSALSVLARPNLVLSLPFTAWALASTQPTPKRAGSLVMFTAAMLLTLAPMALRNAQVTGQATVFPSHGGGTSFYIGNNPTATGRWNDAGGLLSGQVGLERRELLRKLDLPARSEVEDAKAIGEALYARAFAFIRDQPLSWLKLEARKLWLLTGNDELSQDYDFFGERELLPAGFGHGVPFGVLLCLALLGLVAAWRDPRARGFCWLALGQLLAIAAANLVYFTSSQHRLPLAAVLGAFAGPGLLWLAAPFRRGNAPAARTGPPLALVGLCLLVLAQAFVPRSKQVRPSTAHRYNLALAAIKTHDLPLAVEQLSYALVSRPRDPVFLLERAGVLRQLGDFAAAGADLDTTLQQRLDAPWLTERAHREQELLARRSQAALP